MNEQPVEHVEVRSGAYHDSVTLMAVSRAASQVAGVSAAQVAMATDLNLEVLAALGFAVPAGTGPNDLLVALRADDDAALAAGRVAIEAALRGAVGGAAPGASGQRSLGDVAPRTTGSALRDLDVRGVGGSRLALVSVPGPHAFTEAMDAVEHGAHVMVFSDNVSLAQEVRLKQAAAQRDVLVMGPDCGTAVVAGVGLGFATVVAPGPVGVVAASGTGAQQLLCLLDASGVGVRHCLGVGGRDLSAQVEGRSARQALALLDADPAVEVIVVVSKPPAPQVEAALRAFADELTTPVHWALLGAGRDDLTAAARAAVEAVGGTWATPPAWTATPEPSRALGAPFSVLRGAFAGGTLCDEAMVLAAAALGPIPSNIPLDGAPALDPLGAPPDPLGHAFVDFGDDALTRGRPHPMIDHGLRTAWIAQAAATAGNAEHGVVLLLDVVLGHGAHPDPAADLAPALHDARRTAAARGVPWAAVVSLCGSSGDPQGLLRQAEAFRASGADVYVSNADAARAALRLIGANR